MNGLVTVSTFYDRMEAELAKSVLQASGIESMIMADDAGGMRPSLLVGSGARLIVRAEDAERAAELLQTGPEAEIVSESED